MKILSINSGSSSIKYHLFEMIDERCRISGEVERLGGKNSSHHYQVYDGDKVPKTHECRKKLRSYEDALQDIYEVLMHSGQVSSISDLHGIGHRVVHGGPEFQAPSLIDDRTLQAIRSCESLAPLHNPVTLQCIEFSLRTFAGIPQVAVFDTAFHHTIPPYAQEYAIPMDIAHPLHIQRYGFHGTSNQYLVNLAAEYLSIEKHALNAIILHLGNGASATAIQSGVSIDTSMGFTPLEGLIMGTRSGDLDPAIVFYLHRQSGMSMEDMENLLNEQSGLKGICGYSDMRDVRNAAHSGDEHAQLAIQMYVYRIKKYIGAYFAILGRIDALIFSAGIGENDPVIRGQICSGLEHLNICIDPGKNEKCILPTGEIQEDKNPIKILVMATNEELEIARQTRDCIALM